MNTNSNLYQELSDGEIQTIIKINFNADKPLEIKLLEGGMFNTTYKVSYGDYKKEVVLRVGPVNRNLLMAFEKNLMKAEAYVYEQCNKISVPCSKVLVCDTTKSIIDRDYMIVEYIESIPLSSSAIDKEEKGELYSQVGGHIKKLHSITNSGFGRVSYVMEGKSYGTWYEYLIAEVDDIASRLQNLGSFTQEEVENIKSVYKKNKALLNEVTIPKLVHCDLWEGNILVEKKDDKYKVAAIIDSDRAIFGDVDFEFASEWMINDDFMKGYNASNSVYESAFVRDQIKKKLYLIIYALIDSYVGLAQYNNQELYKDNREKVMKLVSELL